MECYGNYCDFSFSSDCSMCLIRSFGHCLLNDALNALNFMGLKFHEILGNDFIVHSLIKRILKTELGEFVVKMKRSVLFLDALLSSLSKYLAKTAHNMFPLMLSPGPIKSLIP